MNWPLKWECDELRQRVAQLESETRRMRRVFEAANQLLSMALMEQAVTVHSVDGKKKLPVVS